MPQREGRISGEFPVLLIKTLNIADVERVVDILIVVCVCLQIIQIMVGIQEVGREQLALTISYSPTQLVGDQETILAIEIIFSANLHTPHEVATYGILVHRVVAPGDAVAQTFTAGMAETASAAHPTVKRKEEIVFLSGIVKAYAAHGCWYYGRQPVGDEEWQRSASIDIDNTI